MLETMKDLFPGRRFRFCMGILRDKDWKRMVRVAMKAAGGIVFTTPGSERAVDPARLAAYARSLGGDVPVRVVRSPRRAYRAVMAGRLDYCICGSLYLVGDILRAMGKRRA